MIDLKPYGAFVENTIRPLLSELHVISDKLNIKNFDVDSALNKLVILHALSTIFDAIKTIVSTAIIGYVAWKISA